MWDCYAFYDEQGQLRTYLELEFDSTIDYARLENSYLDSTDTDQSYGAISPWNSSLSGREQLDSIDVGICTGNHRNEKGEALLWQNSAISAAPR